MKMRIELILDHTDATPREVVLLINRAFSESGIHIAGLVVDGKSCGFTYTKILEDEDFIVPSKIHCS